MVFDGAFVYPTWMNTFSVKIFLAMCFLGMSVSCQHRNSQLSNPVIASAPSRTSASQQGGILGPKKYFKSVSAEERREVLSRAAVFLPENNASQINIVEDIVKPSCDPSAEYIKNNKVSWPKYTCDYVPDTEKKLSGGSPKFLCEFLAPDKKSGKELKKIKYSNSGIFGLQGEVSEAILATNLSRLLGFVTTYFCPMQIVCRGCPSRDPWNKEHSTSPKNANNTVEYPFAMAVADIEGHVVGINEDTKSVFWDELKIVSTDNKADRRNLLIEREAWMLWIHFIQHTDSHPANQQLICLENKLNDEGQLICTRSYLYTHDFGYAFNDHLKFELWSQNPTFQPSSNECRGILDPKNGVKPRPAVVGLILGSSISEEAKNLLLDRLLKLSDEQWKTAFNLARAEKASRVSAEDFLAAVKVKIVELQNIRCPLFSEGKSALSKDLQ